MKCLALVALLVVGVTAADLGPEQVACIDELHMDKDVIAKLLKEDVFQLDNDNFMKYLACFGKKTGIQNEDGTMVWDKVHDILVGLLEKMFAEDSSEESERDDATTFSMGLLMEKTLEMCCTVYHGSNGQIVAKLHNCFFEMLKDNVQYWKRSEWEEIRDRCRDETKVDKSVVDHVLNDFSLPEDDEHINKYMDCLVAFTSPEHIDIFFDWHKMKIELKVYRLFHAKVDTSFKLGMHFNVALEDCRRKKFEGSNGAQSGVKIHNCIMQHFKERFNS